MKIILVGIQGAGKSTQGNLLCEKLKIPYLSTGHIFREMAKEQTPEGNHIKETLNSGNLIPDDQTLKIVSEYLQRTEYQNGYILDGFPRTTVQAEVFKEHIDYVFYLKVSDKEALWRLSGRDDERLDTTLKAIRKRIDLFHQLTEPVLEYYNHKGILLEIDGEQSIEEINKEILSKLQ
ncbi:MAG: nucleoside monophosphate kinase [Patescibacteria group bacterium]